MKVTGSAAVKLGGQCVILTSMEIAGNGCFLKETWKVINFYYLNFQMDTRDKAF